MTIDDNTSASRSRSPLRRRQRPEAEWRDHRYFVGGAAIVSQGPLQIGLGELVELRVENYRNVPGHVVRAHGGSDFAIAFDLDEDDARQFVDDITENDGN